MVSPDISINPVYAEGNGRISTYAATSVNPTASLTIGGDATNKQVITSPGSVGYRSHTVTVEASDIESYSLVLSGPTNLTSGTSTMVSGAGGKTPAAMSDNTWGYSWNSISNDNGNDGSGSGNDAISKENATYNTLSPTGSTLTGDRISNFGVNFTRNLFFAAKFSEDADSGRYRANVTLSLAATPRAIATGFGGIVDMQNMTGAICASVPIGTTGSLEDIRDQSVYTVAKLSDGNCWMTQNLRLVNYTTTDEDSQTGGFTIPDEAAWSDDIIDIEHAHYNGNKIYGAYYNWYTATAGTGTSTLNSKGAVASGSICPKGWRLPTNSDHTTLYSGYPNADSPTTWIKTADSPSGIAGRWLGATSTTDGGTFYSATGAAFSGKIMSVGGAGQYWSNVAYSDTYAYFLYFDSSHIYPTGYNGVKRYGLNVRCIADDERTIDDISTMQEMTPKVCENSTTLTTDKILTDTRDGSTYTVNKLSDGKCWMTQNLRIMNKTITDADSDLQNATTKTFTIPSSNAASSSDTTPYAYYNNDKVYGGYYNWCAATAGTCAQATTASAVAAGSVCPKGWKLPTNAEYTTIATKIGKNETRTINGISYAGMLLDSASTTSAFFPFAGYANGGTTPTNLGTGGRYWSSTSTGYSSANFLTIPSGVSTYASSNNRYYLNSVRCIAK